MSGEEDDEENSADTQAPKNRKAKIWQLYQSFDDEDKLNEFLAQEYWWRAKKVTRTQQGMKQYFYCSKLKYGQKVCKSQIYIFRADGKAVRNVFIYGDHTHGNEENLRTPAVKNRIFETVAPMIECGLKYRSISQLIARDENIPEKPSANQVNIRRKYIYYIF